MRAGFFSQLKMIVAYGVKAELSDKERLLSPILFGATMLVLFSFALGDITTENGMKLFVAETFITAFLAVQICFSRIFEPDTNDRVFDLMRTYPVSPEAWFLGKYILVVLLGLLIVVPTAVLAAFLNDAASSTLCPFVFLVLFMVVAGLSSLGVLLSAMTLKSSAKQILFPLIYYPLTAPVLLAAVQVTNVYLLGGGVSSGVYSWSGILVGFGVIYFTLGLLLFGEIVRDS